MDEHPSLNMAVARLGATELDNYAVWVFKAPYPGGYVIENSSWTVGLSQIWQGWQELFSPGGTPSCLPCHQNIEISQLDLAIETPVINQPQSYSSSLMQHLGLNLWQWLFYKQVAS